MQGPGAHPFLYTIKAISFALTNMNVTYVGTGAYATYSDGTPVKMDLTALRFRELSPVYNEDYADITDGSWILMTYFRQLPNIQYQNFLNSSTGSQDYLLMKNIFLRGKLRDDLTE